LASRGGGVNAPRHGRAAVGDEPTRGHEGDADRADAADVLRFIEEAQITGQLAHPNIVPVYELGSMRTTSFSTP